MKRLLYYPVSLLIMYLFFSFLNLHFYTMQDLLRLFHKEYSNPIERMFFIIAIVIPVSFAELFYQDNKYQ